MSEFARGALSQLLNPPASQSTAVGAFDPALMPKLEDFLVPVHPAITSPEIKHLAAKMLADPNTSPDGRRLAGSVMAHIERHEPPAGAFSAALGDLYK